MEHNEFVLDAQNPESLQRLRNLLEGKVFTIRVDDYPPRENQRVGRLVSPSNRGPQSVEISTIERLPTYHWHYSGDTVVLREGGRIEVRHYADNEIYCTYTPLA